MTCRSTHWLKEVVFGEWNDVLNQNERNEHYIRVSAVALLSLSHDALCNVVMCAGRC